MSVFDNAPLAEDDINVTEINLPVTGNVLTNDGDPNPDDDIGIVDPVTGAAATGVVTLTTTGGGSVAINPDGSYVYTPAVGFDGEDTFTYTVTDENGNTDEAEVSIEVRDRNVAVDPSDPDSAYNASPIASDDTFTLFEGVPLTSSVTGNDSDPDGDSIVVADPTGAQVTTPQTITTEQGGSVTLNPDGTFTYTPPVDFLGQDSFDYAVVDSVGLIDQATVTLTVIADSDPAANDDPQANDDVAVSPVGEPATVNVLTNDIDPNGDPVTVTEVDGIDPSTGPITVNDPVTGNPAGTLVVDPTTGEATFTPEPGFTGTVQLPYTVDDSSGGSDTGTLIFQITDTSPVAEDDSNVTDFEVPVTGNVLTNDHDDNPADSLTIFDPATGNAATGPVTVATVNGGTAVVNPDGSYELTPAAGFAGVDTFEYTAVDTFGKTDSASVSTLVRGTGQWSVSGPSDSDEGSTPQFTVSLSGVYGEGEVLTVDLGFADNGTNSSDHADFVTAVQLAVDANPDITFDPVTGTISFTSPSDSTAMPDLVIELALTDDGLLEGPEDFTLGLTNATSSTGGMVDVDPSGANITSTINDAQDPNSPAGSSGNSPVTGPGQWSVSGPGEGNEGSTLEFVVSLSGEYGEGEVVTVDLGLNDISTNANDHEELIAAIEAAVANNPDVTFDPMTGTLTYTSPADGASMEDLAIDFTLVDDGLIEGSEVFTLGLSNAGSPTGAPVALDTTSASLNVTINDTEGASGQIEEPGLWSVSGPAEIAEAGSAEFTVSLSGEYGEGEVVTVDLEFTDISSSASDHEDVAAAIQAAVASNPDLSFDPVTGTLTYTSPADGASMADLMFEIALIDDGFIENSEEFAFTLANPGSSTGANVEVDQASDSLTSTIADAPSAGIEWSVTGSRTFEEFELPQYRIFLSGTYGEGVSVQVDVSLINNDTARGDFGDLEAALQAAADANPDVVFRPVSQAQGTPVGLFQDAGDESLLGTFIFTSPADGASMADLVVNIPVEDDRFIEDPEDFVIALSNASSTGDVVAGVNPASERVLTTIVDNDFVVSEEPAIGSARPEVPPFVPAENVPFNILDFATIGLNRLTATLSEAVITETVNKVASLDSIFGTSLSNSSLLQALNSSVFEQEVDIHTRYYGNDGGSKGFSSGRGYQGTTSIDATDERGRFYIDTIVQGESLAINAHSTIDPQYSSAVTGYTATMANGDPLPPWISELSDGQYIVQLNGENETIRLTIVAHRECGYELARDVQINTLTGFIEELPLVEEATEVSNEAPEE